MNAALLGSKYLLSDLNSAQTVEPERFESSWSRHLKIEKFGPMAPIAMPSFSRYQVPSAFGSCALKKMPPMRLTRSAGSAGGSRVCIAVAKPPASPSKKTARRALEPHRGLGWLCSRGGAVV